MNIEPILMLPGMFCDARVFSAQMTALGRDGVVAIAPTTGGERVEEVASAILTGAPAKFALFGHGYGGVVAQEVLRRAPDRVTRIALMGTTPLAETPQDAADREVRIVAARSGRFDDAIGAEIRITDLAVGPQRNDVFAKISAMAKANGPDAYVRQARAMQRRKDQQAVLRRIKQPALVICGAEDGKTPVKRHEFMAELIPYARLEVIDGAGHMPMLEQPQTVTSILQDWLRQPFVLR